MKMKRKPQVRGRTSTSGGTLVDRLVPTLYEDDLLLAVAKPAGVDAGGRGERSSGVTEILLELREDLESLQPINRLSRYESGILLMGKESTIVERIRAALRGGAVRQEYLAVVLGRLSRPRLEIDSSRTGLRRASRTKDRPQRGRVKRSRQDNGKDTRGSDERDRIVVTAVQRGTKRSYVRCRTRVETTHALKARLRGAGLRVLGDSLHDDARRRRSVELTCLHLTRMTFPHPGRKSNVTLTCKPPSGFATVVEGGRAIERLLHAGLTRRLPVVLEPDTDAYRLLTGDAEDLKGLVAERYGPIAVLQVRGENPALTESVKEAARWYKRMLGVQAVYVKDFRKQRGRLTDGIVMRSEGAKPLVGKAAADEIEILERGLKFAIRPHEGSLTGLFLDQRDNRTRVRDRADGRDVLNLFAYTCGFSVAAAVGGAAATVSVDLSSKHLEWGKVNFALNNLDLENHEFIRSDAGDYLKRAKRQGKEFDLIIIDAPTFAHGRRRKQSFSIARDLPALVGEAAELLRPGGEMLISTNNRGLSMRRFKELVKEGAETRNYRITATPSLPADFAVDPDHAKAIFVALV